MSNKKSHYIKKGASPRYKRPTIPIKILRKDGVWATYYVAKFGEKNFVYTALKSGSNISAKLIKKYQEKGKYIPLDVKLYENEMKDLLKERRIKDKNLSLLLGSKFTKHISAFSGVVLPIKETLAEERGSGIVNIKDVYENIQSRSYKNKDGNYVFEEVSKLKNGIIVKSKFEVNPNTGEFKLITKNGNSEPKIIEGQIIVKKSQNGELVRDMIIKNIKNYDTPELIGFLTSTMNRFDNVMIDKQSIENIDNLQLIKLKQAGFVNSERYTFSWLLDKTNELKKLYERLQNITITPENVGYFNLVAGILKDIIEGKFKKYGYVADLPKNFDTFFLLLNKEGLLNIDFPDEIANIIAEAIKEDIRNNSNENYTLIFQNNTGEYKVPISSSRNKEKDEFIKTGLSRIILHSYSVQYSWNNDTHFGYYLKRNNS